MRDRDLRQWLGLISRFAAAGVVNTAIGASLILALDVGLGVNSALANLTGYAVGIGVSWLLQRRFVFRSSDTSWAARGRYVAVVAIAFAVNQGALWVLHQALGMEPAARVAAQLCAIGSYTVVQFVLFRAWVFADRPSRP